MLCARSLLANASTQQLHSTWGEFVDECDLSLDTLSSFGMSFNGVQSLCLWVSEGIERAPPVVSSVALLIDTNEASVPC